MLKKFGPSFMGVLMGALLPAFLATGAWARPLEDAEQKALMETLDSSIANMEAGNAEAVIVEMPPRVFEALMQQAAMGKEALQDVLVKNAETVYNLIDFSDVHYAIEDFDLIEGEDVDHGFVIFDMTVSMNDQSQELSAPVLVVHERADDKWYALRVEEPQVPLVAAVYPDLEGLQLPKPAAPPKVE